MIIVQNTQRVVIPKDGAIFWTGATAPVGWEFFDTPNNYYLMGNSSNSFSALGASTHYHNNTDSTPNATGHNNHGNGITVKSQIWMLLAAHGQMPVQHMLARVVMGMGLQYIRKAPLPPIPMRMEIQILNLTNHLI